MGTLNFPEFWLNRVIEKITSADQAPFLQGIAELPADVIELGEGSASEQNIIHIPLSTFEPGVEVNFAGPYPLDTEAFSDSEVTVQLDRYQTKATSVTDDQLIGSTYDRIDGITASHIRAINKEKYGRGISNFAPASNASKTPVLATTGTAGTGLRMPMVYADLVAMSRAFDAMDCPKQGRRAVLSGDHYNDLLLDRQNFGDQLVNYKQGQVAPMIAGFEVYTYINNPGYNKSTGAKLTYGTALGANYQGSVFFWSPNVAMKTGMTKQYFQPAESDPKYQQNLLNYRHYFLCKLLQQKYSGALYSKDAA